MISISFETWNLFSLGLLDVKLYALMLKSKQQQIIFNLSDLLKEKEFDIWIKLHFRKKG